MLAYHVAQVFCPPLTRAGDRAKRGGGLCSTLSDTVYPGNHPPQAVPPPFQGGTFGLSFLDKNHMTLSLQEDPQGSSRPGWIGAAEPIILLCIQHTRIESGYIGIFYFPMPPFCSIIESYFIKVKKEGMLDEGVI